ncbi:MAG TPA: hypothetical protein EYG21_01050 [Nitrospinaceae bacterium]|jgi:hypothetical protein|nr:hypothetical protein [Nitrospinaceae bacterium]
MSKFLKGYVFSPQIISEMASSQIRLSLINTRNIMFSLGRDHSIFMKELQEQICYLQREISLRK